MRKIIISLLLAIFLISFASATLPDCQFNLPTVKAGTCTQILQSCTTCTFANITVIYYPQVNSTVLQLNVPMDNFVNMYNYTFCDTNTLGTYIVSTIGDPDGFAVEGNICFESTVTGYNLSLQDSIFVLVTLLIFIFLLIFFVQRCFKSETVSSRAMYFVLAYVLGLLPSVFFLYVISSNYVGMLPFVASILYYFFLVTLICTVVVILAAIGYMITDKMLSLEKEQLIKRGHSAEDAHKKVYGR